jgi:hypothetical protein
MSLLEDVKRITEKATGWKRPEDPRQLLRDRKPQTYRFKDDGLIPNHPKWPLVIYKSVVRSPPSREPRGHAKTRFTERMGHCCGCGARITARADSLGAAHRLANLPPRVRSGPLFCANSVSAALSAAAIRSASKPIGVRRIGVRK